MPNQRQTILEGLASDIAHYKEQCIADLKSLSLDEQRGKFAKRAKLWLSLDEEYAKYVSPDDDEVFDIICDNTISQVVKLPNIVYSSTWKPWLNEKRSSINWSYSERYFKYLSNDKHWSEDSIDSIRKSSDVILDHCGNPFLRKDVFVKGLVVGDIQSGKTASYTAVINKAIDAGFKVIIVFTGTTNELRAQTQKRLDYEIMGLTRSEDDRPFEMVGVGKYQIDSKVSCLTNANLKGDLKTPRGTYDISDKSSTYLAVIKKRPSTLDAVIQVIESSSTFVNDPDHRLPYPVLIIDDEADLASINTNKTNKLDEASGTNRRIRQILCKKCKNVTYIGYTATPFANVFVKPYEEVSADDADDIFPDDFIVTLQTPPGYSGVKDFFGITQNTQFDDSGIRKDLLAEISEDDRRGFKKYTTQGLSTREQINLYFPNSLKEAMMCFLIGVGIKISRNIIQNCTMLVNVDVRTIYNQSLRENVRDFFDSLCKRFSTLSETREEFRLYWEENMKEISKLRLKEQGKLYKDNWASIEKGIDEAIKWKLSDSVKLITGSKDSDTLDYSLTDHALYIVVGGPKLSRGLTLEGLSVSYYGRNSHAFDTLLQMGRWFGYRRGWIDVCRVFTTKAIANNFIEAAISLESFKKQIEKMNKVQSSPREFGLQVLTYATMMPTSPVKMRDAVRQKITFSGSLSQILEYKFANAKDNLELVQNFVDGQRQAISRTGRSNYVFENVSPADVLSLLRKYKCPSSTPDLWINYINRLTKDSDELSNWTVLLSTLKAAGKEADLYFNSKDGLNPYCISKARRAIRETGGLDEEGFRVRVLTAAEDFIDFFNDDELKQKPADLKSYKFDDPFVIKHFNSTKALLAIYVFDPKERDENGGALIPKGSSSVGLAIWFPVSKYSDTEYRYINQVMNNALHNADDAANAVKENNNGVN